MSNIIYIFWRKTLPWGMAIFSEKSHQQGRDPSFNPLFSATRSLNTRALPLPSPLSSQHRIHTLLSLNAQMTVLAHGHVTQQTPWKWFNCSVRSVRAHRLPVSAIHLPHGQITGSHLWMKWNERGPCKSALTEGRIIQEKSRAAVHWHHVTSIQMYFFFASLVILLLVL